MNLDQLTQAGRNKLTVMLEQGREDWERDMLHWKKTKGQAGDEMRKWYSAFKKFHEAVLRKADIGALLEKNSLAPGVEYRFRIAYEWALREREIIDNWEA